MKIWFPRPGQWVRLKDDWAIPQHLRHRNENLQTLSGRTWNQHWHDFDRNNHINSAIKDFSDYLVLEIRPGMTNVLTSGTVFALDRLNGDYQVATLRLLASPQPRLNPRKHGGKMAGAGRFYVDFIALLSFPEVEDVPH